MLLTSSTNRVTFSVNVFGTAATPTVRCVVGDSPAYSFSATKVADGKFESVLDLPKDLPAGDYPFRIEVLLNGRLFTPINHSVSVAFESEAKPAPVAPAPETPTPAEKPDVKRSLMKTVSEPAPLPRVPVQERNPAELGALEALVSAPIKKMTPRIEPGSTAPKPAPAKINMASIAAEVAALEKAAPKKAPPKITPTIQETTAAIPVQVVRGSIIFR